MQTVGASFTVKTVAVDEEGVRADTPAQLAVARAGLKAGAVAARLTEGIVIGADTLVVLDDVILGKPRDEADARRTLQKLSGREHEVITGLALCPAGRGCKFGGSILPLFRNAKESTACPGRGPITVTEGGCLLAYERTAVMMRAFTDEEVDRYVATGEPLDKAGAYGIQERGALLVKSIVGDYFNVVGLPIALLQDMLGRFGVRLL